MKKTYEEQFGIDEVDKKIIKAFNRNPNSTYSEIGKSIGMTQPAVGMRFNRLKEKGILTKVIGTNVKKVDIYVAIVHVLSENVEAITRRIKSCEYISHAFRTTGKFNFLCFITAPDSQTIEEVVNEYFRKNRNVHSVKVDGVIESVYDFIVPLSF